jgi:hypothetical protein
MGGAPYEACVRLVAFAGHYWEAFDGELASRQVDPLDLPVNRFLNAIYAFLLNEIRGNGMQRVQIDEAKTSLENELSKPLPGAKRMKVSDSVVNDEMALFRAAASGKN